MIKYHTKEEGISLLVNLLKMEKIIPIILNFLSHYTKPCL